MEIRGYGEIIVCRNIKFEDNKIDLKRGHPGVVLLPTDEKDEEVFCLYMTSDKKRAKREKNKYVEYSEHMKKDSYINLYNIIKSKNNIKANIFRLKNKKYIELVEKFKDYQESLKNPNKNYIKIKDRLNILIELVKYNMACDLGEGDRINSQKIDKYINVKSAEKRRMLYGSELILFKNIDKEKVNNKMLFNDKERIYTAKLMECFHKICDIKSNELKKDNNILKDIYLDFRTKYFLINTNSLFRDSAFLLSNEKANIINKFIDGIENIQVSEKNGKECEETNKINNNILEIN